MPGRSWHNSKFSVLVEYAKYQIKLIFHIFYFHDAPRTSNNILQIIFIVVSHFLDTDAGMQIRFSIVCV